MESVISTNKINITNKKFESLAKKCLNHITDFKLEIEEANICLFINDDVLNRFMVARGNDEKNALNMWEQWVKWKLEFKPECITIKEIKNELASGKAFIHGYDKEGRPCIVVKNCKHIPEKTDLEEFMRFFIYTVDKACRIADE
jgi:hypothetical protein